MDENTRDLVLSRIDSLSKFELVELFHEAVQESKHKIDFYDAVANSRNMIDMSTVAKVLGIEKTGRNKLFKLLRNKKILRPNNEPYQEYVDRGYFKLIEQKVTLSGGEVKINIKPVVSQKGLDFIRRLIDEAD